MEWILYLLCPLMMLFCMKGLFSGGKKDCNTSNSINISNKELDDLRKQLGNVIEQNKILTEEVKYLQGTRTNVVSRDSHNKNNVS
ncbi:hypothetical protein ACFSCX_09125 [Bacillus salitolerans]|uniref:DUF2933 domain-containing protein n=1 Tax=Bacillus salitolerans TaxID=1437434 RepID=A0ABW4LP15_9BACI